MLTVDVELVKIWGIASWPKKKLISIGLKQKLKFSDAAENNIGPSNSELEKDLTSKTRSPGLTSSLISVFWWPRVSHLPEEQWLPKEDSFSPGS